VRTGRVKQLAERYGIAAEYENARGETVVANDEVLIRLLQDMGVASADGETDESQPPGQSLLPPVAVVQPTDGSVIVRLSKSPELRKIEWTLTLENGELRKGAGPASRDGDNLPVLVLPALPFGYHSLHLPELDDRSTLIVTPGRCFLPERLNEGSRAWGISLQLYLLRSEHNWGIGDFSDLATLARLTASAGCDVLGLNPLHQMFPDRPEHASPYSPATRRFLNILYIDVEAIPEFSLSEARELVGSEKFKAALALCRAAPQVDYTAVTRLKLQALRLAYRLFGSHASETRKREFAAFVKDGGELLQSSSLFQALSHHFSEMEGSFYEWQRWPGGFRSPGSPDAIRFKMAHEDEIRFFDWSQWVADQQLAAASSVAAASGMEIGLYRDLAVGCDRAGAETWSRPSDFLTSAQVGAPPDILNPAGQNWGLPPFNPVALRKQAYFPFIDLIRANMRHAGGLRIDHVMGLQRLYCIPEGSPASEGAYLNYPIDDLIGILALESHRSRCLVVGEDLGTVPAGFREKMAQANILSYRVLFFEQDGDRGFIGPDDYPALAVSVAGSHDLPTLHSWLLGTDIELKRRLELYPSEEETTAQRALRGEQRAAILKTLELEDRATADQFSAAVHRFLSRTRSVLTLAQLDDLIGEREPVNVPATSTEHPNWRRKYSASLDELSGHQSFRDLVAVVGARD
jgi:4-alpha-glucanotransferase